MGRNKNGQGLFFWIIENIPYKIMEDEDNPNDMEMILFDFLVKPWKWLCVGLRVGFQSQNKSVFLTKLTCQYNIVALKKILTTKKNVSKKTLEYFRTFQKLNKQG